MTERIWNKFLTERDKRVFELAGYGARQGFGKRPALLVIDVNYAFCGDRREPVLESIKKWRQSGGEAAWDALPIIRRLIDTAHEREMPVIYTTGVRRDDNWDAGAWAWKNSRSGEKPTGTNQDGNEIMPQIAPSAQDIVIYKQKPSGFHGTNLAGYLTQLGCDSVIITGTATSGCVRATVVDAFSHNYRVTMVEDACFERSEASHAIALCDLNAKYADVIESPEVLAFMESLPRGMFNLPKGSAQKSVG
ncbi:isochorismatase family protein [Rhizobium sp. P32RR-XVIII]|nr:isochorismatase family protein [Rhizobium sp. P32RR-XVIII]